MSLGGFFLPGTRIWLGDVEITSFIRTGDQPVTVRDGQVVFANTGRPWYPGPTGVRMHLDESGDETP